MPLFRLSKLGLFEMSSNGFTVAGKTLGELLHALFAATIKCPQLLRVKTLFAAKTLTALPAFVSLLMILSAVFFDLF